MPTSALDSRQNLYQIQMNFPLIRSGSWPDILQKLSRSSARPWRFVPASTAGTETVFQFNPYLWIVDKKTTNREYDGASFVDKKSTQNPKSWFLGMSGSVICGQKIHINFFEKIRKIGFWECHGASFVDKKSTLIFFLKNSKNWVLEMSWSVKFGQRNYAYPLEY